ncbi:UNVERIFIED_CONTAM: Metacaspase-1 [Sesamum angustifolium]|uniref:Metacaspase-1 n=1 Tax=Sesamum angustifolium TaxID=2727405 RepID=A0AAW2QCW1_9LAMI
MEMASKRVRCSYCGVQIVVPPYAHAIRCAVCQTVIRIQPNDPLIQAHSSFRHAASRLKDLLSTASSSINTMVSTMNHSSGSGTSGFGGYPQARPSPSLVPVSAHGTKRAVLCGVSYNGQKYRLKGTVNDIKCMRYFLIQKLGFPSDCILVLTEEESDPSLIPTKNNIRTALKWLVQGCQSGDSLIFHYSGHGSQQLDFNMDEVDGYDEMLWPVDHQTQGTILDDEINATIVRPLPQGAKLHAIIDACHSGTILDLPFFCRMDREGHYAWENHGRQSAIYKGTSGGLAVSLSACDDHQVSVDTTALSGNAATGAMTYSFIQAAQNEPGLTYGRLLNAMRQTIRDSKTGHLNGPVASLLKKALHPKLRQVPQLSSSETFDIYSKHFVP